MTINEILDKYSGKEIEKYILNYSGEVEEFQAEFELPLEDIGDEEATAKYDSKNYVLTIIVE